MTQLNLVSDSRSVVPKEESGLSNHKVYQTGEELRTAIRQKQFTNQTAGQAPDYLQGNVVILPKQYAQDFLVFCLNNPKPCPLIGISKPGDPTMPSLGNIDIRTDVPRYRVYRNGILDKETDNISNIWTNDLVTFALGCSFTFEDALTKNGFKIHHITQNQNVPMFRSNIQTTPGGIFRGPLVVTMRSFPKTQIPTIFGVCAKYEHAHGTPIYWGNPKKIGIKDLQKPDYGDPIKIPEDEVPVFWACGVTPQAAIQNAQPNLSVTHAPGCMLVTDLKSSAKPNVNPMLSDFADKPAMDTEIEQVSDAAE